MQGKVDKIYHAHALPTNCGSRKLIRLPITRSA